MMSLLLCIFFADGFTGRTEATTSKEKRSLGKEIATALLAASFLGFGSLFLLLWVGLYI